MKHGNLAQLAGLHAKRTATVREKHNPACRSQSHTESSVRGILGIRGEEMTENATDAEAQDTLPENALPAKIARTPARQ
jgi:hypothetical protein